MSELNLSAARAFLEGLADDDVKALRRLIELVPQLGAVAEHEKRIGLWTAASKELGE